MREGRGEEGEGRGEDEGRKGERRERVVNK